MNGSVCATPTRVVWDIGHDVLTDHPEHAVSVFFFGVDEHAARPDHAWFRIVETINSKNAFMAAARPARRSGAADACRLRPSRTSPTRMSRRRPSPATSRPPSRCRASASTVVKTPLNCAMRSRASSRATPVQIQQEVVAETFLNMQYQADADGLHRLATTEQLLDGFVHQGNRHPARCEPWEVVEPMAQWLLPSRACAACLHSMSRWSKTAARREHLAIECNPRFNGASYPTAVAHKLGIGHWLARTFQTKHRDLAAIDLTGIEYDPATGEGVVLVNWGPILVGKLLVLLAGEPATQQQLARTLEARL